MSRAILFRSRQGFTLIELLVVISIIALLISILLPSLGKAREAAIRVTSMSNAKGLGTSIHSYAADNNAFIPYTPRGDITTITGSEWSPTIVQRNCAGIDIWGHTSNIGGHQMGLMGLGALAAPGANATPPAGINFGSYLSVEQLYPPALLGAHGSRGFSEAGEFAKIAEWFGHQFQTFADGFEGTNPDYVWWSGATTGNFYMKGGYIYRGQDNNRYNGVVTGNANTEWTVDLAARNANTSNPGFNLRTQIMEASSWHAGVWGPEPAMGTPNRGGGNIIFGDGAGIFWANEDYASAKLTPHLATQLPAGQGWATRSPVFNEQNQYAWSSLVFNVADIENGRMEDPRP